MLPKISIVTPSFNQGAFIETAIKSIVYQNYENLEYFVFDGGSSDKTLDILHKYSKHVDFWVSEKDEGQSDAISKGISRSSGEIIGWINSDDALYPGSLNKVGKFFELNPDTDVLIGGLSYADSDGKIIKNNFYFPLSRFLSSTGVIAFGQQSMFFRKSAYEKVGSIRKDFHFCMDTELVYRFLENGCEFKVTHNLLGVFRWHQNMKSINREGRKAYEEKYISRRYNYRSNIYYVAKVIYIARQLLNGNYLKSLVSKLYPYRNIDDIWNI